MADVISFYAIAPSQGKRTLSLSFAELLASNKNKVLYVELDTTRPSVALSTRISHPVKNAVEYFRDTKKDHFNVEPHVLNRAELIKTEDRDLKRVFSDLQGSLDYLTLPIFYQENNFPNLIEGSNPERQANEYIQKLIYSFKTSNYDYVILNLPNELESLFGFEVIAGSDQVINVITASANRLNELKNTLTFLNQHIPTLKERWTNILNMASPNVNEVEYKQLMNEETFVVPFDPERQKAEFSLETGSPVIKECLGDLALYLEIPIIQTTKSRFSFLKKSKKEESKLVAKEVL